MLEMIHAVSLMGEEQFVDLFLENGPKITAPAFGDFTQYRSGELVFTTAMTGIEESLSDPSFAGQILLSSTSHVGNTGINLEDKESKKIWAEALFCRNLSLHYSSWRSQSSLKDWILQEGRFLVHNLDTRFLTLFLREHGSTRVIVARKDALNEESAQELFQKEVSSTKGAYLLDDVSVSSVSTFESEEEYWPWKQRITNKQSFDHLKIAVWDFGVKKNTLRLLKSYGVAVEVYPAKSLAEDFLKAGVDALLLSNGPGDPASCQSIIVEIKKLLGQLPVFGICMGHQLITQALGAETFKMKFGHRGIHHPVNELSNGQILKTIITSQNHGFAVKEESIPPDIEITHRHANDGSIEGIRSKKFHCASVQFHPEAAPGPMDSGHFFEDFLVSVIGTK